MDLAMPLSVVPNVPLAQDELPSLDIAAAGVVGTGVFPEGSGAGFCGLVVAQAARKRQAAMGSARLAGLARIHVPLLANTYQPNK